MRPTATVDLVLRTLAYRTRRALFERFVGSDEITVVELTNALQRYNAIRRLATPPVVDGSRLDRCSTL
jgi:hypothetical protein